MSKPARSNLKQDEGKSIVERVGQIAGHMSPQPDRVPSIPLYMDQVLSYLDTTLRSLETNPKEPCFTKTMINNYVKSGVLKPPIKKKYDQDHLMALTMLYRLKKSLQIKDIEVVLGHIQDQSLEQHYNHFREVEAKVGQSLEMTLLPTLSQTLESSQNGNTQGDLLWETIVTLAVEADAKMRLAEELVEIYRHQMDAQR